MVIKVGVMLRRLLILSVLILSSYGLFGQSSQSSVIEATQSPSAQYRLFRTTNMWTFIKLDTITGKIWQVQYDTQGDSRGSIILNSQDLASGKNKISGRFTLYSTQNMWTFILIDQIDGNMWQVQWSQDRGNRLVIPIE